MPDTVTDIQSDISLLQTPSHRYLHAFCINPQTRFEGQQDDEQVILILRSHPITQLPWILAAAILALVPPFIVFLVENYFLPRQLIFIYLVWYFFLISYIYVNVINYLFNVGILTNQRIIDVDYHNVLYKEMNASPLSKIEDVTTKTGGFIRSLFHFGDIFVQSAGAQVNIEYLGIPDPQEAARIINIIMQQHS